MIKVEDIELVSWVRDNTSWRPPKKKSLVEMKHYGYFEIISYINDNNFLVYCWDKNKPKDGLLFKAKKKDLVSI